MTAPVSKSAETIVISEFMDPEAVADLERDFAIVHDPELSSDSAALGRALRRAAALIVRNRTRVTADVLEAARDLRAVGRLGVGLDNIDLRACRTRGVAVLPATGANARSVAEYIVTAAFMLLRGTYAANDAVIAGTWPREALGCALGILGFGSVGQAAADLALAAGFEVVAHDPVLPAGDPVWKGMRRASLEAVLRGSDVVTLHMPLVDGTRNMIGAGALASMKPGAVLINTARGGIVDEEALIGALRGGRLGGAALDVFAEEPLGERHGGRFADIPNLILTPHIAGVTEQSNARVGMITAHNVRRALLETR